MGLSKLVRKHWFEVILVALLATETLILVIVLFDMTGKGSQSFPAFSQLVCIKQNVLGSVE